MYEAYLEEFVLSKSQPYRYVFKRLKGMPTRLETWKALLKPHSPVRLWLAKRVITFASNKRLMEVQTLIANFQLRGKKFGTSILDFAYYTDEPGYDLMEAFVYVEFGEDFPPQNADMEAWLRKLKIELVRRMNPGRQGCESEAL